MDGELIVSNIFPPTDEFIASIAIKYDMKYTSSKKDEDRFYSNDGNIIYLLNDGVFGHVKFVTLKAGIGLVDRYGRLSGRYLSPKGRPIKHRSLSKDAKKQKYHVYKVVRDSENVEEGLVASRFNDSSGEVQYRLTKSIYYLSRYIKEVDT